MSIFGIATVLIDTVTDFLFLKWIDIKRDLFRPGDIFILHYKQVHQMSINFHLIPHLLGVYMGNM